MQLLELDTPAVTHELYLDKEIRHLGRSAGWYGAYPTRIAIRAPRSGRVGRAGYRLPELGVSISAKEFNRLASLNLAREV